MADDPDEFALIAELFAPLAQGFPGALGLMDDVALLNAEPGFQTVITADAMVAGVHFLPDDPADLIARKLVRVNLSDIAAKGAHPFAIMLSAAFPKGTDMPWLRLFAQGLGEDLRTFGVALIGGDTVSTPGPLTLSLTALGRVEAGRALLRSQAQVGDVVWVSGTIGDGALGLMAARNELQTLSADDQDFLADRYRLPQPRTPLGPLLVGLAHAGMDVSDGLVQDLGHICHASGLGAVIQWDQVPLSHAAQAVMAGDQSRLALVLTGGDDYELLFTASPNFSEAIAAAGKTSKVPVTAIGRIVDGKGVIVMDSCGGEINLPRGGWRHFG